MPRLKLDLAVRLLIVVSLLLTSLPSAAVFASSPGYPEGQVEEDTTTPTPVPTATAATERHRAG